MANLGDLMTAAQAHSLVVLRQRGEAMDRIAAQAIYLHAGRLDEMHWVDTGFDPAHPELLPGLACHWPRRVHHKPVTLFGSY